MRALVLFGLVLAGTVGSALLAAPPADAHAVLLRTDPGSGAIVQDAPKRVTLTFNEPVRLVTGAVAVVAPTGERISRPAVRTGDGSTVRVPLRGGLPRGTFLVTYRVISADSHPVAGGFSFSIGAPSKTAPATTGGVGAAEQPVVAVAMPVVRYLGFAGAVLVIGPTLMLMTLWPRRLSRRGPARLVRAGLGLVAFATVAEFYLQMPYSSGASVFSVTYPDLVDALNSRFGWAHLLRVILLLAALPLLTIVTAERGNRLSVGERVVLGLMGAAAVGTWGYSGHPGTSPAPPVTIVSDAAHLAAMAVWLGGLVVLVRYLLPAARPKELAALLPAWSRRATLAVAVLAAAGVLQACLQLGSPSALVDTLYGKLVIVKVVAFAVVLTVAAYSRAATGRYALSVASAPPPSATPAADTDARSDETESGGVPARASSVGADSRDVRARGPSGDSGDVSARGPADGAEFDDEVWDEVYGGRSERRRAAPERRVGRPGLRRLVAVEIGIAAAILGVTAVLVQTTPSRSARSAVVHEQHVPYNKTLNDPLFSLQVQLDPARTGKNTLHAIAYHPSDGRPVKVLEWHATAKLPSAGLTLDIPLKPITDNHALTDVALPRAGTWTFSFTLRVSEIDEDTVTARIPVA